MVVGNMLGTIPGREVGMGLAIQSLAGKHSRSFFFLREGEPWNRAERTKGKEANEWYAFWEDSLLPRWAQIAVGK